MVDKTSKVTTNKVSGEVSVTLDGMEFLLKATMLNVAALQASIEAPGLRMLNVMLATSDTRVIYHGMKCLCISGNADALDDMLFASVISDAVEAVTAAMTLGMPDAEDGDNTGKDDGKGEMTTASPGAE